MNVQIRVHPTGETLYEGEWPFGVTMPNLIRINGEPLAIWKTEYVYTENDAWTLVVWVQRY